MDLLFPFDGRHNRYENIVVQFDNVLLNTNYFMIEYLLSDPENLKKYPNLQSYQGKKLGDNFFLSLSQRKTSLLPILSNGTSEEDYETLESNIDFEGINIQNVLVTALSKLIGSPKIKTITIFSESWKNQLKLNKAMIYFEKYTSSKLMISDNQSYTDMMNENPDGTTFFLENLEDFYKEIINKFDIQKKVFLFPNAPLNYDFNNHTGGTYKFLYEKEFDLIEKETGCKIEFFIPDFIAL